MVLRVYIEMSKQILIDIGLLKIETVFLLHFVKQLVTFHMKNLKSKFLQTGSDFGIFS